MSRKPRVLFLCTHNSSRSQMAEGLLREMASERYDVFSAGTHATSVHPLAREVMREEGIDLSHHRSKSITDLPQRTFDYVITVCDSARDACPTLRGGTDTLHWSLEDPSAVEGDAWTRLEAFRKIRNQIADRIRDFLDRA